jgi:tetratricopeptide (TPR) repeat protein
MDDLPVERKKEIVRHLIRGCERCRSALAARLPGAPPTPEEDSAYDEVINSSIQYVLRMERAFRDRQTRTRAAALLALGEGAVAIARKGDLPLEGLGIFEALLERSWAVRHDNPREMVHLAQTALAVARDLDPAVYGGARKVTDHQARAWGELGNAYRAADNLWDSQRAFGEAFKLLEQGTGDSLLRARLHDLHASLLNAQRKFALAIDALDIVHDLYLEAGDPHLAGRALITKAVYMHRSGRSAEAAATNREGLAKIQEEREPGLTAWATHNQILFLEACGRHGDAKRLLFENRPRLLKSGRVNQLKLRWAEGRISLGLSKLESAEEAFLEVREGFLATGQGFAAALVSMELCIVWLRQGRTREAQDMAVEAAGMFAALDIHREVLGAVQVLRDGFRLRKASLAFVERVVAFIREWEINPDAQFTPPTE